MRVSVIGAGGWGTALALVLNSNGHKVILWEYFKEYAELLSKKRENEKFLKGIKIPKSIKITSDLKYAVESSRVIVLAVPSHIMRGLCEKISLLNYKGKIIISVAKGIEQNTLMRMSEIIKELLPVSEVAVLSGPSHAEEVGRGIPTTVVAAAARKKTVLMIQRMFSGGNFRVYGNQDIIGVELGGAVKNVIAIAAGVLDGLGLGDNTKAALITRGLAEMMRLGKAAGARESTFSGLSGLGDLVVTCESRFSRNRSVGEQLGRGKKISEILENMEMVAEGVKSTLSVYKLAKKLKVVMPISREIYRIIYEGKNPKHSIKDLMNRKLKSESEFLNED